MATRGEESPQRLEKLQELHDKVESIRSSHQEDAQRLEVLLKEKEEELGILRQNATEMLEEAQAEKKRLNQQLHASQHSSKEQLQKLQKELEKRSREFEKSQEEIQIGLVSKLEENKERLGKKRTRTGFDERGVREQSGRPGASAAFFP